LVWWIFCALIFCFPALDNSALSLLSHGDSRLTESLW
ncbi:hypothetical protein LEMLEM_LOCUS25582, partial [Lemmus lemmus]